MKGQARTVHYTAWDTAMNTGKTGDAANHILRVILDGVPFAVANKPYEVDPVFAPGVYAVDLSAEETDATSISLAGISQTPKVTIIPVHVAAGDPWSAPARTLTMTAEQIEEAVRSGRINIKRGDTTVITLNGLGSLEGYEEIWFTVKTDLGDPDVSAHIQIDTSGLVRINRSEPDDPANGAIVVDDADLGNVTIYLDEVETAKLVPARNLYYDIQVKRASNVSTLCEGTANIIGDVTRSI